jgi:AraC-like DNA-binding protein
MKARRILAKLILAGCAVLAVGSVPQAVDLSAEQLLRNLAAKRFEGKPVTIRVTGDRLKSAVEELIKISGLSFVLDPAAAEFVRRTASEENVIIANQMPWDALLDAILREFQLGIAVEGKRLVIRSAGGDLRVVGITEQESRSSAWMWMIPAAFVLAAGAGWIFAAKRKAARDRGRAKFALDAASAEEIKTKILYLFEVEKIYRDEDLSLQTLSARLSLPAHHLSWVINEVLGFTFSRLVNSYRVNEVKKRLGDPDEAGRTILDIAFEAGFNTKTAFNKVFKQQTGITPSEFREKTQA